MTARFRLSSRALVVVLVMYWLALFASTHVPGRYLGEIHIWDKLAHLISYAGLAFLLALVGLFRRRPSWAAYGGLFAIVVLYGAVDELAQIPVPGRSADLMDWSADALGAILGLTFHGLSLAVVAGCRTPKWNSCGGRRN
jgi:VanZ family protein